ncbi:polymorphic toxin-type HINT domain-containing protein [Streptomyces sp. NBC_01429]|uniref:polymorphic toxin-type HINT domain-containing protein n=1 Tax=Streptomyces sp. NBC_01429 TaxID=2903862 RepID=UPI002E2E80BE|nr:polymorphic toxin-type HINT domain-containing protein [Streptomyces sp. NBC_01429]
MRPPSVRLSGALLRRTSLILSAVLVGTILQSAAAPAVAKSNNLPGLPGAEKPVVGAYGGKSVPRTISEDTSGPVRTPRASWPAAVTGKLTAPNTEGTGAKRFAKAKGTPIGIAGVPTKRGWNVPPSVETRVLDRKHAARAGVNGLLFTLEAKKPGVGADGRSMTATDAGSVALTVDYADFADAFGGSFGSRMGLVELPACVLTTPAKDSCRTPVPVATTNDATSQTLTAQSVALRAGTATVLAVAADAQSDKGDYKATPLSASASWTTNLNTGDFGWSYDMPVPGVPGSLTPNVGLSYSSGTVDGRTGGTNNQASWVGDGFDMWPGSIERRYKSCADDGEKNADGSKPGDQCWAYDNAFLSFNGKGGELVPVSTNEFKLKQDDGTRITRLKSTDRGNGDNDGEYWRLITPGGTEYYFGYNRLPGWATGNATTDSTWTVPVFGNNTGEPCNAAAFKDSWCQQAWRWNLDYVVDPRGNAIAYHYTKETNNYGRNLKADDNTTYTRGGYLKRIDYGLNKARMYTDKPLAQVVFSSAERCLPVTGVTCAESTIDDKAPYWYDTPWDLNCMSGAKCDKGRLSPSFWTRKRLTDVTTQTLKTDGTYAKVDSWKLAHRWGKSDVDYQLLLDSVQRTGESASPAITLPKTTLAYTQLQNRLDKTGDGVAPFIKARLSTIADESGGQVDVNYSAPECDWSALPAPQTNTSRCFPQYIGGDSSSDPELNWFNKYVVTSVTTTDRTGGAPDAVTRYQYLGGAAWHFDDDDGLTKEKSRTWSQWRGYGQVRVQSGGQGGADAMKSQQDSYFLRGMDGDRKAGSGGTKSVSVPLGDGEGDPITDHESAVGFGYKSVTFDKPGGLVLEKSASRPWYHETAKKVRDWGTVTANFTGTSSSRSWTSLDDGAGAKWRSTSTATKYDTVAGRVTQADDFGDDSTAADNRCTRTTYASDSVFLLATSRVETIAKSCAAATVDRAKDVLSDVRTAYDGGAYGAAPTKGDVTAEATLKEHTGTKATYLETGTTYDSYGRVLTGTDLTADVTVDGDKTPVRVARRDGRTTTATYTPATGLPTQVKTVSPPAQAGVASTAQTDTQDLGPRGLTLKVTDTNSNVTEYTYDALGRGTKVWLADRRNTQIPNYEFAYHIADGKPTAVAAKVLNNSGAQATSYVLYDGFLRERQSQDPGPAGGSILTDVFYDERGQTAKTFAPYYTTGKPSSTLFKPENALSVETQTRNTFDGLGRPTETRQIAGNGDGGTVLNTIKTLYGGDRSTIIPPVGGVATTNVTNARGQITALLQHHQRNANAPYDTTTYTYTPRGELDTITDQAGSTWSYAYDQLGRQTKSIDPDKGTVDSHYDDRGQLTDTKNDEHISLFNTYDNLGRKTHLREGSTTGTLRAKWEYDTVSGAKGQLAASIRYVNNQEYVSKVTAYDRLYRATRTSVVIPAAEGKLQGTYQTSTTYKPSGLVAGASYSAAGSLPGDSVVYDYDDETLRPTGVFARNLSSSVSYSLTGKPLQYGMSLASGGKKTQVTNTYEWGTQRLATSRVDREDQNGVDRHVTYRYNEAGDILSMADVSRTGTDNQCFAYDYLGRLTEAWTQSTPACANTPQAGSSAGPAPYWQSFTYDQAGNRGTETQHSPAGDTSKDVKRTYTYPAAGKPFAHSLTSVATTSASDTITDAYEYDATGNTITRSGQKLAWDAEGHLAKVTEGTKTTEYLYDTDGNRLIGRSGSETTLYLGHTEVVLASGADKTKATRYVDLGGGQNAIQNDNGSWSFTIADHHGTGQLAVNAADLAITQRRTLPFGAIRGDTPKTWPGTKGFVGGTDDTQNTGLTHLGAREYDPTIGRFLSVDPLLNPSDPESLNGYSYAHNSPLTYRDPSGLMDPGGSQCGISYPCTGGGDTWQKGNGPSKANKNKNNKPKTPVTSKGDWEFEGANNRDFDGDGYINVYPEVKIPVEWGPKITKKFISYFYMRVEQVCHGLGGLTCMAGEEDSGSYTKRHLAAQACQASKCPGSKALLLAMIDAGASEIFGYGPGAGAGAREVTGAKGRSGKRGSSGCTQCFLAGTEVLMADGKTKKIEDVQLGDEVWATDPETGESGLRKVTRLIVTEDDKHFNTLSIATEDGIEELTATYEHPFWSPSEGRWLGASELQAGMALLADDGTAVIVTGNHAFTKRATTYNLTVDDLHTYYVLAGETPVLVHNSNGCPTGRLSDPLPRGMNNKIASAYDDVRAGRIPSHDTYGGREHPWWAGSKEYRVPGRPETDRILEKELPNGVKVYGWTSTHYTKIQRFSAPHFPDSGWN